MEHFLLHNLQTWNFLKVIIFVFLQYLRLVSETFCKSFLLSFTKNKLRPPISLIYLIFFIVFGIILVTISIELIASGIIHQIHYMGRKISKARELAGKIIQVILILQLS